MVASSTAVFFLGAAVLHVSAAADHTNLPVMMVGFLCVATAQAAFGAVLLWRRPERLILGAGLALMLGAIATWLVSRAFGLPFLPGGHAEPIGFKDGVTVLLEVASLPGLLLLASHELRKVALPSPRLGSSTVAAVSAAVFVLFMPALVLGGGGHHSAEQFAAMGGHGHGDEGGTELASAGQSHGHAGDAAAHGESPAHGDDAAVQARSGSGGHGSHQSSSGSSGGSSGGLTPVSEEEHGEHGEDRHHGEGGDDPPEGGRDAPGEHHGAPAEEGHAPGGHGADHGEQTQGGGDGGPPNGNDPGSFSWGDHRFDYEPARPASNGDPGSGYAFVYRGPADSGQGTVGHHSDEPCEPTAEQQAAADRLYRETDGAIRGYDNNAVRALADGFTYAFPITDRIIHMVNPGRVTDPTILRAEEIESFLYVMTDRGLSAVGGMYIMPKAGMPGPQIGGCLTRWHEHAGLAGRLTTAGTKERTPEMLHVWTYPGLAPYGHYDGRTLSQLWQPGSIVPSLCRESGDSSDVCLP